MMRFSGLHTRLKLAAAISLGLTIAACGDGLLDLEELSNEQGLTSLITLDELEETIVQPTRVKIKILPGGLIAREVEVETDGDDINDEEEIESRIVGLAAAGGEGTLTLLLGDLQVGFTDGTRFRQDGGDDMTFDEFVARVTDDLANNRQPPVRAERQPAAEPQAPDVATFIATRIRLEDDEDREAEIEINIDGDNLVMNGDPPPDAWINVLGLTIELRVSDGTTELEAEEDDDDEDDNEDQDEFEDAVTGVDLDAGTFALENGTIVRVDPDQTKTDADGDLFTLEDVKAAVDAGEKVRAEGDAVLESACPPVQLLALHVKFEVDEDEDDDEEQDNDEDEDEEGDDDRVGDEEDFEDTAASLTIDEVSTLKLNDGTVVLIDENTEIKQSGKDESLNSLDAVLDALNAGQVVETKGKGTIEASDPLTIAASEIEFEVEDEDEQEEDEDDPIGSEDDFEHTIRSLVIDEVSTMTLDNGTIVLVGSDTEIKESGKDESLNSLEAANEALTAGKTVRAKGKGLVEAVDPLTIWADEIEFEIVEESS